MKRPFQAYAGDEPYVFASYARDDAGTVFGDLAFLHDAGINVWYDEGIAAGSVWRDSLAEHVSGSALCLFFVSGRSLTSTHCLEEVSYATSKSREVLLVYLEDVQLPSGMEMTLGYRQALHRRHHSEAVFREQLVNGLRPILYGGVQPAPPRPILPPVIEHSIAVLPLENLSPDPDNMYLADGIAEELLGSLARIKGLEVTSRSAAFAFRNSSLDASDVGERLGVATVLEGSLRRSGNRVRISIQLVNVATRRQLWSERYDHELDDLFDVQDDIARRVADAVVAAFGIDAPTSTAINFGTRDITAYNAYLMGRYEAFKSTPDDMERALVQLDDALRHDPMFLEAHISRISVLQSLSMFYDRDVADELKRSQRELRRLDPEQKRVNFVLDTADDGDVPWNLAAEELLFREMICNDSHPARTRLKASRWANGGFDVQPSGEPGVDPHTHYGLLLAESGLYAAGAAYLTASGPQNSGALAATVLAQGDLQGGIDEMQRINVGTPTVVTNRLAYYGLLLEAGQLEAAQMEFDNFKVHLSPALEEVASLIFAYRTNDHDSHQSLVRNLSAITIPRFFKGICAATLDAGLGLARLVEAADHREILLRNIRLYGHMMLRRRDWHALCEQPGFTALLDRLQLGDRWYRDVHVRASTLTPITGVTVLDPPELNDRA